MEANNNSRDMKNEILNKLKDLLKKVKDLLGKLGKKVTSYDYGKKFSEVKDFASKKASDIKSGKMGENLDALKKAASEKVSALKTADYKKLAGDAKSNIENTVSDLKSDPKKLNNVLFKVIIILVLFIIILLFSRSCTNRTRTVSNTGDGKYQLVEKQKSVNNFAKLKIDLKDPESAEQIISNEIINGNIARKTYRTKDYTYRLSASKDKNANRTGYVYTWVGPIHMDSLCDDFRTIRVIAHTAVENPRVIKAEWADNNIYYCMTIEELLSREAFLQEVNKVVVQNHVYDKKYAEENKDKVRETMENLIRQNAGQIPEEIQKYIDEIRKNQK